MFIIAVMAVVFRGGLQFVSLFIIVPSALPKVVLRRDG
jgi:hypothetical protein